MEGLVNPNESDLKEINYDMNIDRPICSVEGIWYVEQEERKFGIEEKIKKLNNLINVLLDSLNNISYNNKENLINTIKTKQNLLNQLLKRYENIKKSFIEYDSYYRKNLFFEYNIKYWNASIFSSDESKICLSVMNDIQIRLKKRFENFLFDYFDLRNSFFDINNYIIKVKKLFNIEI